jgi:hypothetical protein
VASGSFYTNAFVRAFPMVVDAAEADRGPRDPRETLETVWPLRTFQRFAHPFGLINVRDEPDEPTHLPLFWRTWQVRKGLLFNQLVTWQERAEPCQQQDSRRLVRQPA